ncbi:UNVERIFIED_CONTAM: hypothetical protein PYX00_009679 [Menopon gallinae]|uniref:Uncharacterized protein n=1 Tax=Menopon gallinae TaxID=328185 RepID=A0AAW2HC97_9NEOP
MGVTPVTGADTLEEALELKRQLGTLLMAGGFELAKWASNSGELAPNAPRNHVLSDGTVKTLGLHWNPAFDVFGFQDQLEDHSKTITNEKHPVILSAKSSFTKLLVLDFHRRTLHGGPQLTLGQLSGQYWIIGGRNLVKGIVRNYTVCFRYAQTAPESLDGPTAGQQGDAVPSVPSLRPGLRWTCPTAPDQGPMSHHAERVRRPLRLYVH